MEDRTFQAADQVFCSLLRDYRARGKNVSQHKAALTNADMELLYSSGTLSNKNPEALPYKVYFELSLHCARRGCEGLRDLDLRRESFTLRTDENGHQYVILAYHEFEKNHQGVNRKESDRDPRMCEQLNDPTCPVASFKKYVTKLNPGCDAFYSGPKPQLTVTSGLWIARLEINWAQWWRYLGRPSCHGSILTIASAWPLLHFSAEMISNLMTFAASLGTEVLMVFCLMLKAHLMRRDSKWAKACIGMAKQRPLQLVIHQWKLQCLHVHHLWQIML